MGMNIDFHSHIIPQIDDGSDSVQTSIEMLKALKKQGVDFVVATPHFLPMRMSAGAFLSARNTQSQLLEEALISRDLTPGEYVPKILLGAEVAYCFEIEKLSELEALCIEGTNTLLLEMPMRKWGMEEVDAISSMIYDRNLNVVIAHFERYFILQNDEILHRLFKLPIYIQVNAHSLCVFTRKRQALKLFTLGPKQVLGSDTHNMTSRPPFIKDARDVLLKKFGQEKLDEIDETAKEILYL